MGADKKWIFALFSAAFVCVMLFLSSISGFSASYYSYSPNRSFPSTINRGPAYPPTFAYYISGGSGDGDQIFRLLLAVAVYHPRNWYLLHIGKDGSDNERRRLAIMVKY